MARTQVKTPQDINTIEEAENALAEIGELLNKIENIDAKGDAKIGQIKAKMAADGKPHRDRIKEIQDGLSMFSKLNKQELFRDKKTVETAFGSFGFRKSTSIRTKKTTLELLAKLFSGKGIRTKEQIDKEALAEWSDEDLAAVDAAKVSKETFGYVVNREEVNKRLLQQGA